MSILNRSGQGAASFSHEFYFNKKHPIKTFYHFFDREQKNLALAAFFFIIKHSPVWAMPVVTANIITALSSALAEGSVGSGEIRAILINLGVIAFLVLQNIPTQSLFIYFLATSVREIEGSLRLSLVRKLQQLSFSFHDRYHSGAIQSKVLRDVESIRNLIMLSMNSLLPALVTFLFALWMTLSKQPLLTLVFVVSIPIAVLVIKVFRGKMRETNAILRQDMEKMNEHLTEMIEMIPVTRAHGLERMEIAKLEKQFSVIQVNGVKLDVVSAVFGAINWVIFQLLQVLCLAVTIPFALQGRISVGDVVLFQGLYGAVLNAVSTILNVYPELERGIEAINSIGEILEDPEVEENEGKLVVQNVQGNIDFKNVYFSYPGTTEHAIEDFTLSITAGQSVAFVGASGSGKSTLMQLVLGLRRPSKGAIFLDGQDLSTLDMRTVRHHVSVVPQSVILFSGTIRENITYGLKEFSEEQLIEAARMANALEFIEQLPKGFDTPIGEYGSRLSGGQRQRIAIARALIRNPRILILDEATSALDVASERQVQIAIEQSMRGRTTLIVAHRLSTIRHADLVVVLERGRLVEMGTYRELVQKDGFFSRLVALDESPVIRN
ncbi:MAG TPA: ABC transporter ATP-binding protein [Termitinemataceae bacterium]|nr:ABC transporter ATP-binding protein [Termitinemataceae bacterium]HOM22234.1 ABC transporter ATP-binding protein [Termitinemataceae bacterium]HPP99344.1 ABC transporter ATP-binding protein [Termitinemataceae bacterium]